MADKTFRQTVEEILFQLYGNMEPCESCSERGECTKTPIQCALDRICKAVLKMAEGMPKRHVNHGSSDMVMYNSGANDQYEKAQDYWRKQVE